MLEIGTALVIFLLCEDPQCRRVIIRVLQDRFTFELEDQAWVGQTAF